MVTKVISREFCKYCKEKTTQGLIVKGQDFTVRQCLECRAVRTYLVQKYS